MKLKEYALYKGEDLLAMGTAEEIAREIGVKKSTVYYYASDAYKKKVGETNFKNAKIAVSLDD